MAVSACGPGLPDPDAAGAQVLRARCGGCHRVFAPGSLTFPMWQVQLARMRDLFARRGIAWLAPEEERALVEYLRDHAGGV